MLSLLLMHNIINLRTQRITYFIPSVDVFCYCHFWDERTARCKFIGQVDFSSRLGMTCTLRYDTIEEINVDSKAEYTA